MIWMKPLCITQQALYWEASGFRKGLDQPKTNWRGTVQKELQYWDSPENKQKQRPLEDNNVTIF